MKIEFFEDPANSLPLDDFLGLSPKQMHDVLYSPHHIVCLKDTFDQTLLSEAPIVQKTELLLKLIGEAGEAKATKNGYLPKKIVNALYDFHPGYRFTVPTETYSLKVLALRHAITDCGWMKKRAGKFSLTKKGEHVFDRGFSPTDYIVLLKYWMTRYSWGFTDSYPSCPFIQQAVIFSLYLLHKMADKSVVAADVTQTFVRAFPYASQEFAKDPYFHNAPAKETFAEIFRLRFLNRFAAYFGLIDYLVKEKHRYLEKDKNVQIKTTKLFSEVFCWLSPDK